MLLPPRLHPGDTIGIVSPSAPISSCPSPDPMKDLEKGVAFLKGLGFQVHFAKKAFKETGLSAGSPQERAEDIHTMFADSQIQAILASHGGLTANGVLAHLDWDLIRANPKIFVGFSDISVLLMAIHQKTGMVTFHGNTLIWHFGLQPTEYDRREFLDRLVQGKIGAVAKNSPWKTVRGSGRMRGRLFGGHYRQITRLFGTPYWPDDLSDILLFMEFVTYEPAELEAIFTQMTHMGVFEQVRGVLIGHVMQPVSQPEQQPEAILCRVTEGTHFPIVKTDDFGHKVPNTVLPVGGWVELDVDRSELTILEACVR